MISRFSPRLIIRTLFSRGELVKRSGLREQPLRFTMSPSFEGDESVRKVSAR